MCTEVERRRREISFFPLVMRRRQGDEASSFCSTHAFFFRNSPFLSYSETVESKYFYIFILKTHMYINEELL